MEKQNNTTTKGTNQNTKHEINHYTYSDALTRQPGELGYHNNNMQ